MKKKNVLALAVVATVPALGLADHAAAAGTVIEVDIMGINSWDSQGLVPPNETLSLDLAALGLCSDQWVLSGLGWSATIETVGASWLDEPIISFANMGDPAAIFLTIGAGDSFSGVMSYSAPVSDLPPALFTPIPSGFLDLEFFESFDDVAAAIDATYTSGTLFLQFLPPPEDVTPDVIFGSGNANGGFTIRCQDSIELGMRGKLRNPPMNIFNSNGDGTYTFNTGSGDASFPQSEWTVEWSVNTDRDDSSGLKVGDLTYEIGMDNDPGAGTDYLVFNNINPGFAIPWTPPSPPVPFWDHAMGDNATVNGGGVSAPDAATYGTYLATFNVAQNSWKPTFFQDTSPYSWDPDVPGRYEYYLKAFDGGVEVAKTAITIIAVDGATMSLEADPCQTDTDPVKAGTQIEVELWLRNPDDDEVTGWAAFLDFDIFDGVDGLTYEGADSSYGPGPFTGHIQPIATAGTLPVPAGQLWLDGNTFDTSVGTTDDELLATLVFTIAAECVPTAGPAVSFDLLSAFPSTLSFDGLPIFTSLLDAPSIVVDDGDPPTIACPANITQPADAGIGGGCLGAVVTWADPVASDTCSGASVVCTPSSGSFFPIGSTTVTCTATDGCGNTATCTFDVEVTPTNLVCVDVQLDVFLLSTDRCIQFVLDCGTVVDVSLTFDASGLFTGEIEVPCGIYSAICAKDEQHTQWANADLVLSDDGTKYVLDDGTSVTPVLDLLAGDTDDDGDVDINDVTLLLAQFGGPEPFGDCPWNNMRGADFNNDGNVGTPDYTLLAPRWLTMSECIGCPLALVAEKPGGKPLPNVSIPTTQLDRRVAEKADLNRDGMVDFRDVQAFEIREGLPDTLSTSMMFIDLQNRRKGQR